MLVSVGVAAATFFRICRTWACERKSDGGMHQIKSEISKELEEEGRKESRKKE
jgi:hypothetical protein